MVRDGSFPLKSYPLRVGVNASLRPLIESGASTDSTYRRCPWGGDAPQNELRKIRPDCVWVTDTAVVGTQRYAFSSPPDDRACFGTPHDLMGCAQCPNRPRFKVHFTFVIVLLTLLYDPDARIAEISNARHESQRFQCATIMGCGPHRRIA